MLVLSRTPGTSLVLNEDRLVTIETVTAKQADIRISRYGDDAELSRHTLQRDEGVWLEDIQVHLYAVDFRPGMTPAEFKVRLGIEAPREMTIHRLEVYEAIRRERPSSGEAGSQG